MQGRGAGAVEGRAENTNKTKSDFINPKTNLNKKAFLSAAKMVGDTSVITYTPGEVSFITTSSTTGLDTWDKVS